MQSLGVIYINHNIATEQKLTRALSQQSDVQEEILPANLIHEPGSDGQIHASAVILPLTCSGALTSSNNRGSQRRSCPAR